MCEINYFKWQQYVRHILYIYIYSTVLNDFYKEEDKKESIADTISNILDTGDLVVIGDFNGQEGNRRTPGKTKRLIDKTGHNAI